VKAVYQSIFENPCFGVAVLYVIGVNYSHLKAPFKRAYQFHEPLLVKVVLIDMAWHLALSSNIQMNEILKRNILSCFCSSPMGAAVRFKIYIKVEKSRPI
jgi:hypothetical protein